ncbi:MAG: rfbN [Herbinix sp.]|jgi:rhamnosyltransferase|nr:rfbN [Herbinix sp.]
MDEKMNKDGFFDHKENNQNTTIAETSSWKSITVDVIIPTFRSDDKLNELIKMLYKQTKLPRSVIILHTQEYEGQPQPLPDIKDSNITVVPIDKNEFDHGGTRRYGADLSDADILMFMTQDAVPEDQYLIEKLIAPYEDNFVAATYGRQLPKRNDTILEKYTRSFNYPKTSRMKSKEDIAELGIKTFFCSNVCATYRNKVYQELGGFVKHTIFNEDMIMAFSIIRGGYKIAYAADALVVHSHHYTYWQQFTRNFDLGVSHKQYEELFLTVKSETEGVKLVKQTMQYLCKHKKYWLIPDLILTSAFKYAGYRFGLHYKKLPKPWVIRFSMYKAYWK